MAKRMLTPEEKGQIVKERCSEAMIAHPDKMIFVRVEDESDENGEAIVWVHRGRDTQSKLRLIASASSRYQTAFQPTSSLAPALSGRRDQPLKILTGGRSEPTVAYWIDAQLQRRRGTR